ncbi:MAG: exodeoxyribonuclease VII large subunit [Alphaproteobacteria bacterium]
MATSLSEPVGTNLQIQSVSEVSNAVKRTVEQAFGRVRIRGEISRPTYARSGHLYLTLKDDKSVLDAVAWRGTVSRLSVKAEEGMEVIVEGRLTTFPGSSKYQMVMESMELAGEGALLKLLEDRKRKLQAEGLFDQSRKQELPFIPRTIGVVTSPTGAVIRDICHRLRDRFPSHVLVWPVQVQGKGAAEMIAQAIRGFDQLDPLGQIRKPDVLIVARGGGSLEDLWCFNEEAVVRAVADCSIPTISAVGHETDTTLIDYVSDKRAPTPTAAAEMAVPVRENLIAYLDETELRAKSAIRRNVGQKQQALEGMSRGLINPERALENLSQRLDDLSLRADRALSQCHQTANRNLSDALSRLPQAVGRQLDQAKSRLSNLSADTRMPTALKRLVNESQRDLESNFAKLKSFELAETKALERGYARVWSHDGQLLTSASAVPDEGIELEFFDGRKTLSHMTTPPIPDPKPSKKKPKPTKSILEQGSLF